MPGLQGSRGGEAVGPALPRARGHVGLRLSPPRPAWHPRASALGGAGAGAGAGQAPRQHRALSLSAAVLYAGG